MKQCILKYYEWEEIEVKLTEKLGGRNLRDYAGKWEVGLKKREGIPHLDFWHWWLENAVDEPVNNSYQSICVSELIVAKRRESPEWVLEILLTMETVLGRLKDKPITIHYEW